MPGILKRLDVDGGCSKAEGCRLGEISKLEGKAGVDLEGPEQVTMG